MLPKVNLLAQLPAQSPSWTSWLPGVLQEPATYFAILVTFAAFGLAKGLKSSDAKYPYLPDLVATIAGLAVCNGLKVGGSYIYASGTGIIAAWGASSFYALFFFWATNRIRNFFGVTPPAPSNVTQITSIPFDKPLNPTETTIKT